MRYNDIRDGTNIVEDVLNKYKAAWKSKGMIQENGLFVNWYSPNQDKVQEAPSIGFTAWLVPPTYPG
jgi:Linalool dehydratase/isomerase